MTKSIEQRLKIIKLLIIIRYLYELQKALAAEQPEPAKNEAIPHDFKKAFKKPPSIEAEMIMNNKEKDERYK